MLNYHDLFHSSLILINGPSRSGTSILGKLLGSMTPAYYLYEPAIFQYSACELTQDGAFRTLFEDYFLPIITGRSLNWQSTDDTHWRSYYRDSDILWGARRSEVLEFVARVRPKFIIKFADLLGWRLAAVKNILTTTLPSVTIVRDGCEVVASALSRGWYTDSWLEVAITSPADALPPSDQWMWRPNAASPATRAACLWRNFMTTYPDPDVRYEDLRDYPIFVAEELAARYGLGFTNITRAHITSLQNHRPTPHDHSATIAAIDPRERDLFMAAVHHYRGEVH